MILSLGPMGQIGVIRDDEPQTIPLNAWTDASNVHFRDGKVVRMAGYKSVLTPSISPLFALYAQVLAGPFWIYAGTTAVYATDNSTHADITRAAGAYGATADKNWTGGILGGIPILNNGVDAPQAWLSPSLGSDLVNLTNWPALTVCGSLRPFRNYLVAIDVTEGSTRFPHMVRWSHPADPGAVPLSWDYTDPTFDCGRLELKEATGYFVDQETLRDINILYKEDSCFGMQFIGGNDIFRFFKMFDSVGMLTRRCAVEFFSGKHAVLTADDIVIHDGQSAESLLKRKLRRTFFNEISSDNYKRCFVATSYLTQEIYFCYPEAGASYCSMALVWNWDEGTLTFRELPNISHIASGAVDFTGASVGVWDSDSGTWDTDATEWDYSPIRTNDRRMLWVQPLTNLFGAPYGVSADTGTFTSSVERTGIGFPLKVNAPPDFTTRKLVSRFWPHLTGSNGTVINCYIGTQDALDGQVTWQGPFSFTIGTSKWIDCMANGRLHAFRFSTSANTPWNLSIIDVNVVPKGTN